MDVIKCEWWKCAAWHASEGQPASRADIVSFGEQLGGRVGGRARAWRSGGRALSAWMVRRASGRAGRRVKSFQTTQTFIHTLSLRLLK